MTKHELAEEVEQLRSTLEQAQVLIADALGYESDDGDGEDDEADDIDEE